MNDRMRAFLLQPGNAAKAESSGHWLRALGGSVPSRAWCVERRIPLTKAQVEGVDSLGGFTVPIDFDGSIIAVREETGTFRHAEVRKAAADSAIRPRRAGGVVASFVQEGQAIPESNLLFDAVESVQHKLAVLVRASSELFEDNAVNLGAYIITETGYAYANMEDDIGWNGDGTSTYAGMVGVGPQLVGMKSRVAAQAGHDTFAEVDAVDIANLMAGVLGSALTGSAWYMSPLCFAQVVCRLSVTSGGLVMTPSGPSWMGFPVRLSQKLPNVATTLAGVPMFFFGNLAQSSMLVERRPLTVAMSWHRAIEQDQVLIRGTERIDILTHDVGTATTVGPIACLQGT